MYYLLYKEERSGASSAGCARFKRAQAPLQAAPVGRFKRPTRRRFKRRRPGRFKRPGGRFSGANDTAYD
jgi:hypothetical protein